MSFEDKTVESKFDGEFWPYLGWRLLSSLISVCTLGFCYPFGLAMVARYEREHTIIDGKRLTFDGKGSQFIGPWILYNLLTIVTCGIFGLWIPVKKYKWIAKHTHFEGYDEAKYYQTHSSDELSSYYDGKELPYVGWGILAGLIQGVLCGILTPFGFEWLGKVHYDNTVIDGCRLSFKGKGGSLIGNYFCWMLLTAITCGIFSLWIPLGIMRWEIENVTIAEKIEDIYSQGEESSNFISDVNDEPEDINTVQLGIETNDNVDMTSQNTILIDQSVFNRGSITALSGREKGYVYPVDEGEEYIIGKDPREASIVVDASFDSISRKHCGIKFNAKDNNYMVIDYSTNGTYINSIRKLNSGIYVTVPRGTVINLAKENLDYKLD